MIDRPATAVAAAAVAPVALPRSVRQRIFLYLGILIVLLAFGAPSGGLMDIPISFFLKNKLHLEASEVAEFRLVSAIPLYLSCVFGFIRDTWNPFGMRDRGFMLLFGTISAGLYVFFAFTPVTSGTLLVAVVLLTTSFLFVASAQNGLTSMIGPRYTTRYRRQCFQLDLVLRVRHFVADRLELAHFVGTGEPRTTPDEFDPAPLHAVRITGPDLENATSSTPISGDGDCWAHAENGCSAAAASSVRRQQPRRPAARSRD